MFTTTCIYSKAYEPFYNAHKASVKQHLPDWGHTFFQLEGQFMERLRKDYSYKNVAHFICAIRPAVVLELFRQGYKGVLFLGADVIFYNKPELLNQLITQDINAAVTPHIISPIPEDGKTPSNEGIIKTGHINSDFVFWKNTPETKKFLEWQAEIHKTKCVINNTIFLDQSWLNCLPFFVPKVEIIRHPGYNTAYYNLHEREIKFENGIWKCNDQDLVCYQFTGWKDKDTVSVHQTRQELKGNLKVLYEQYAKNLS